MTFPRHNAFTRTARTLSECKPLATLSRRNARPISNRHSSVPYKPPTNPSIDKETSKYAGEEDNSTEARPELESSGLSRFIPSHGTSNTVSGQWAMKDAEYRSRPLKVPGQVHQALRPPTAVPQMNRPFRLAVIGSGPAGFYAAYRVMARIPDAVVDMYEKLPVPFGLVRFGVAPDHPEVKNCQDRFTEVAESPRFNFIGNVNIGTDITLPELRPHYDAVLFAYGAAEDRTLGVPGENLAGIHSARAFVGWYNGLPEYADLNPNLEAGDTAVVVGQGNVALDVARVLLSGVDRLKGTDITDAALDKLARSKIREVRVVGRRGPVQASFTIKEVRELMQMPGLAFEPIPDGLLPGKEIKFKLEERPKRRIADLLLKHTAMPQSPGADKKWALDFMRSPKEFIGSSRVESVLFDINTYAPGAEPADRKARVISTGETAKVDTSLVFRSIGYKSVPLEGLEDLDIVFDHKNGIIANEGGRVLSAEGIIPGLYCAGWVKNGPTGVIATTMDDAFASAEVIAQDWGEKHSQVYGWEMLKNHAPDHVDWGGWTNIDAFERAKGAARGKEREKLTRIQEMLDATRSGVSTS